MFPLPKKGSEYVEAKLLGEGVSDILIRHEGDVIRITKLNCKDGDDPRDLVNIPVSQILIDDHTQRNLDPGKIERMRRAGRAENGTDEAVLWELFETPTIAQRDDDRWVAIEGQHRIQLLREEHPDSRITCTVAPGGKMSEARIAYLIQLLRKPHTPYERYEQRLVDGEPYAVAVNAALEEVGLYASPRTVLTAPGTTQIGAVSVLDLLARRAGSPAEGQRVLAQTLSVMSRAFAGQAGVWQASLLRAVGEIILRNEDKVDLRRLYDKLQASTANEWVSVAQHRRFNTQAFEVIAREIIDAYNKPASYSRPISWQ